jgi:hypothetical protein
MLKKETIGRVNCKGVLVSLFPIRSGLLPAAVLLSTVSCRGSRLSGCDQPLFHALFGEKETA